MSVVNSTILRCRISGIVGMNSLPAFGSGTSWGRHVGRDRVLGAWMRISGLSGRAPITMAHVCAAAVEAAGVDGAAMTVMVDPTIRDAGPSR
ncbi:hypothetical protein [Longispora urticae]